MASRQSHHVHHAISHRTLLSERASLTPPPPPPSFLRNLLIHHRYFTKALGEHAQRYHSTREPVCIETPRWTFYDVIATTLKQNQQKEQKGLRHKQRMCEEETYIYRGAGSASPSDKKADINRDNRPNEFIGALLVFFSLSFISSNVLVQGSRFVSGKVAVLY